jgi:hypothetical protein
VWGVDRKSHSQELPGWEEKGGAVSEERKGRGGGTLGRVQRGEREKIS